MMRGVVWVRYRAHQKEVFQEDSMHTIGFICIDCQQLKADLINHCIEWQRKFTGLLNEVCGSQVRVALESRLFLWSGQRVQSCDRP